MDRCASYWVVLDHSYGVVWIPVVDEIGARRVILGGDGSHWGKEMDVARREMVVLEDDLDGGDRAETTFIRPLTTGNTTCVPPRRSHGP